ncbi:MAG: phosphoribosylformylglycinamidine synthase [Spirochaetaceae bacterium]|jgi:phosphoribosylformylglycinamidine synthase|nr:phosphoribosylformylglycinamidine synthase [Spirochaetaceae bacterium]
MPDLDGTIRRVYVEKKQGFDIEARRLQTELADFLGAEYPALGAVKRLRLLRRYDVSRLSEAEFRRAVEMVFSEPQCDRVFYGAGLPAGEGDRFFGIEYVPGQYDQRSDSAEQCAELVLGVKPRVKTAEIYIFESSGEPLPEAVLEAVKRYLINPVDSREAPEFMPDSLEEAAAEIGVVPTLEEFSRIPPTREAEGALIEELREKYGLAMSGDDLRFCRSYFAAQGRSPTLAELRVLDTYWSDHCRHTTFTTELLDLEQVEKDTALEGAWKIYEAARNEVYGTAAGEKKRTLMDMATIGAKVLKKRGLLPDLDESPEINACTIRVTARFSDGSCEPWLLLFKNETHNHPTEIEPFGGAATCLGGAIRDPLSGRAYVHQALRVSGGGDPRRPLGETRPGKLPQVKIAREAAAGYASYGNQIGLNTGLVAEFYHPGFIAKRLELGAVIGAVPQAWVRREAPREGDVVILLGGKTGRDGIGGATGSSKAHTGESVDKSGAEVQKGNAVEERKLQRLFRNPQVTRLIKRCNDFGAGGVAVAVGELAPGLDIDLDQVPKKYAGLDGTELAISESQERMAVVIAAGDTEEFIRLAAEENLDAVIIATVTASEESGTNQIPGEDPRLRMTWQGKTVVDLSRSFLASNGAPRSTRLRLSGARTGNPPEEEPKEKLPPAFLLDRLERELCSLRSGSRRGLQERFDGSIGAASILFPWGGETQGTPECGMAALLPSREKQSFTASIMTFGYDPVRAQNSPYEGAKGAVREALAKVACLGGDPWKARLSFQEYFERMEKPESWGKPAAALLGALEAQIRLAVPAIGGKDSMSGTYRDTAGEISVPPTLAAFAVGTAPADRIRSGALSGEAGNVILLLRQPSAGESLDEWDVFKANMNALAALTNQGLVRSAYPVGAGGTAAALAVTAFGNHTGVEAYEAAFGQNSPGSVLVELSGKAFSGNRPVGAAGELLSGAAWAIAARTLEEGVFRVVSAEREPQAAEVPLVLLWRAYEYPLAQVYPQTSRGATVAENAPEGARLNLKPQVPPEKSPRSRSPRIPGGAPLAVLPVFPGTNCEWDMEKAFREAGAKTRLVVFKNRNQEDIAASIRELAAALGEAQILALSGGFSAGDEPDGSGKFIANVLRSGPVAEGLTALLEKRDGLVLGICNGFQALVKLGLVPYGSYRSPTEDMPTLTFNTLGRHVSRMVRTKVMSTRSPWLALEEPGAVHILPVSHGEGRLVLGKEDPGLLFAAGQIPFCYVDAEGFPTQAEPDNPNGSDFAIEGLTSPDGRILGKMAHSERRGTYVHINIPGNKIERLFEAGVSYFK